MMKRAILGVIFILTILTRGTASPQNDTTVYLITCAPGTEIYSLWGHSALRVVMPASHFDKVYNWGVFDFDTPNFTWKFARGRLNYKLGVYGFESFLRDYFLEHRSVISQKINLSSIEKLRLMILLDDNAKPENMYYRYDFLYDNCSSRIRDIIEKLLGDKLIYDPVETEQVPTFRDAFNKYTQGSPWLKMGIDFLVGTPADKKASLRDRMFLPDGLQKSFTRAIVNRDRKMLPLLYPAETLLDIPATEVRTSIITSPIVVFSLIFMILLILSARYKDAGFMNYLDIGIFLIFAILAVLMIFFNFFTDHIETKLNLNIIWFNPFLLFCLSELLRGRNESFWFRIAFAGASIFIVLIIFLPDRINTSYLPVILILLLRSSARSGFEWNPFRREA